MANAIIKKAVEHLKSEGIDALNDQYVAVDKDYNSLFLTTKSRWDDKGTETGNHVYKGLEISLPLRRAIAETSSDLGTLHWHERGLEFSWSYHPDRGVILYVLVSRT